jgi:hypothetical protein
MSIQLTTPAANGTPYSFDVDARAQEIVITSQNNNHFRYKLAAIRDLYIWLRNERDNKWVYLGTKNENEQPNENTVEAWARDPGNPVGGFYGVTQGNKGRFASFIPPILECMGLVEVEHNANNNRVRAL